jgi:calcineurin-like phosphoesterase family protein
MNGDEILENIMKTTKNEDLLKHVGDLIDKQFKGKNIDLGLDEQFNPNNYKVGHKYDPSL